MTIRTCEIELTNRCNANCIMCPRDQLERPFGKMKPETLMAIIDKAAEYGIETVTFSGFGEPLLNEYVVDYITYVKKTSPRIRTNITTNAGLLTRDLAKRLADAGLDEIQISFNGWDRESYERTMRGPSFNDVLENIKSLMQIVRTGRGPRIVILPVMTKVQGEKEIEMIKSLFMGLGMDAGNFSGYYICNNRAGYFMNEDILDDAFYAGSDIKFYPAEKILCRIPFMINWFDWRGYVHLCCNDIKDKALLGDIKTMTFNDIENKKKDIANGGSIPVICRKCNLPFLLGEGQGYWMVNELKNNANKGL
ncbi:MAG TPA: radical SAM/SPASM domain-containing protein [Candidatus Omnitrophota bacterium]|nr:radical SAM/SPASM domain-containing protein [Candidatus Omnitrophota bacterium]